MTPPVLTLYGGKHESLRCHGTAYNSYPYEMVEKIDKLTNGQSFFLIILRTNVTPEQHVAAMNKYSVRRDKINELMEFWTNKNSAYRHAESQSAIKFVKHFLKPRISQNALNFLKT